MASLVGALSFALMLSDAVGVGPAMHPAYVAAAVADPARPPADLGADALRKPAQSLDFAGVKPGMKVIEMYPGGGYFTRLISDVVGPKGSLLAIENAGWVGAVRADRAVLLSLGRSNVRLDVQPLGTLKVAQPVDLIWLSQNYHDLKVPKFGPVDVAKFNRDVFRSLVPGGVFLIIDHQANPGTTPEQIGTLHRVERNQVIKEVSSAGFKLIKSGEFLGRADDDHTRPIFDLKGKTDQYALMFVKP